VHTCLVTEGDSVSTDANSSENSVRQDIQSRFAGQSLNATDMDTLVFMVFVEAVQNMETLSKTERESAGDLPDAQSQRRHWGDCRSSSRQCRIS
jgi:hypothetical protein